MRAIHDQAEIVDAVDDPPAERRQPGIGAVASPRHVVVAVVGEMDLADAEVAIEPQHGEVALEHGGALEVEADRQLAVALRLPHFRYAAGQHEAIAMVGDPGDRIEVHPDIDRDVVGAGPAMALQRRHALLRQERQAGMRIPHQGGRMEVGSTLGAHHIAQSQAALARH